VKITGHTAKLVSRTKLLTTLASITMLGVIIALSAAPALAHVGFALSRTHPPYAACPNTASGNPTCEAIVAPTAAIGSGDTVGPEFQGSGQKGGFDPEDLRKAYELPKTGGSGQTVAIVDRYNDLYAESDLQKYREEYKLYYRFAETSCTEANGCFKKIDTSGETEKEAEEHKKSFPENTLEAGEISLDVDMVSAACPECRILLVETPTKAGQTTAESVSLFLAGEEEAEHYNNREATEISNSWDIWEGEITEAEQKADDEKYFESAGVPITFASGDYGYSGKLRWPGSSQYVISTGATRLTKVEKPKEGEREWTEEPWREYENGEKERTYVGVTHGAGTTSGCSKYEGRPTWQKYKDCEKRTDVDVAVVGACDSPVSIYDTYYGGWANECGTSDAAPFVAGIEALSNQYSRGLGAEAFYLAGEKHLLFDVTKGGNGECGDLTGEKFTKCHAEYGYESSVECGAPESLQYYLCNSLVGYDGPTGWGAPKGPLTLTGPPVVYTGLPTDISEKEATLNGAVTPEDAETKYYFEYGTEKGKYTTKTAEASAGSGASPMEESKTVTGLAAGTTYYYRLVATNTNGTVDGNEVTFSTTAKPVAETKPATGVNETEATLNAGVNPKGAETKYYFEYGIERAEYTKRTAEASAGSGTGNIEESKAITGLKASATYHFRVVATNSDGTTDGSDEVLSTTGKPSIEAKRASGMSETGVTLNGGVNPRGSETKYYFEYGPTTSYGTKTAEASAGSGITMLAESKAITGLTASTTYHFRIVATNSYGTTDGADVVFSTTGKPSVETRSATAIGVGKATLNGVVNPRESETKYYFEYGPTVSYGSKTAEVSVGSGITSLEESSVVTGLTANTTYHFRIVATNGSGTTDGADQMFTTLVTAKPSV
jgi:hypothetical protein